MVDFLISIIIECHKQISGASKVCNVYVDMGKLSSTVGNIYQTFMQEELYPTIWDKAGALMYGLVKNHCFSDGNKRIAVHMLNVYLEWHGYVLTYTKEEMAELIISIASDNINNINNINDVDNIDDVDDVDDVDNIAEAEDSIQIIHNWVMKHIQCNNNMIYYDAITYSKYDMDRYIGAGLKFRAVD